jgi:endonuclease G, mitochondrial
MPANLELKATLAGMARLTAEDPATLEAPGSEPTTDAELFEGRGGYDGDFLPGWPLALPELTGGRAGDMMPLKRGGTGHVLNYENFSVIMSRERRLPALTAVNINAEESRRVRRTGRWAFDGRLDKSDQWGDELYHQNLLDRGHMVRREDPNWGSVERARQANRDTFHFTNSCPQMGAMNQRTWLGLEDHILRNAQADGMRVSVYTGPYFSDRDRAYPTTTGEIALIPLAFWKVVAIVTETGRPSATAYKVDQVRELRDLEFVFAGYKTYQISVASVQRDTGLDFSALIPYDGFSAAEAARPDVPLEEPLDTLARVRV